MQNFPLKISKLNPEMYNQVGFVQKYKVDLTVKKKNQCKSSY